MFCFYNKFIKFITIIHGKNLFALKKCRFKYIKMAVWINLSKKIFHDFYETIIFNENAKFVETEQIFFLFANTHCTCLFNICFLVMKKEEFYIDLKVFLVIL